VGGWVRRGKGEKKRKKGSEGEQRWGANDKEGGRENETRPGAGRS
jgi:hypothetical protein